MIDVGGKVTTVLTTTTAVVEHGDDEPTGLSPPMERAMMNQLCKVCGEPAAGFHFGAFTCEGCKSFFGRTYNNLGSVSECKNSGQCVITKKNRTSCKACRLRKCILVGMSKSGSRYGRRSNWFKIHCLLQEQQSQAQGDWGNTDVAMPSAGFSPHNSAEKGKEFKEEFPIKFEAAAPPPPPPVAPPAVSVATGYDRGLLFSPLAPLFPQQPALLSPNPALLLARYRQNMLLDALWNSQTGGGNRMPTFPVASPPVPVSLPEQDSPMDLSLKVDVKEEKPSLELFGVFDVTRDSDDGSEAALSTSSSSDDAAPATPLDLSTQI